MTGSASPIPIPVDRPTPVLDVRGASKRFGGVVALDDVSLEVRPGEVHALVGENGAGKSTLIKIVTGVYRPDAGEVHYRGEPVAFGRPLDAQRAGISTIYQEVNLVGLLSVARNIFLGREPTGRLGLVDHRRMNRDAAALLSRYDIDIDVRRPLREFGLGVQQMAAIVRAISADHRLVIMDEPTSSLEPREVERLFGMIERLRGAGVAVVYVSHRLDEVFRECDRVTVLRDGRRVHVGDVAAISRLQLVATMLGRDIAEVARQKTRFRATETDTSTPPVLEAAHLTRAHLLNDVSLTVRHAEVVGLAGLLGSGRTETAKGLYGAQPLDAGSVTVDGRAVKPGSTRAAIRAGIALIPEDRKAEGVVPTMSVRDNIVLAALPRLTRAGIVSRRRQDELVTAFIKRLRIKAASPDQKVGELSGGNQQKVLLARMLCLEPRVLILDDPTRGIDVGAKAEIQGLVSELAEKGLGVILISSELEEVVEGADSVVVLRDGAIVGHLEADEVTEHRILDLIAAAAEAEASQAESSKEASEARTEAETGPS